jgi:hypothetical protein
VKAGEYPVVKHETQIFELLNSGYRIEIKSSEEECEELCQLRMESPFDNNLNNRNESNY